MISIAVTKPNMNLYVLAKPRLEGSFSAISVRCFDEVAKLREELVVRLSELQAVQPIPGLGRELDCREVSHLSPEAHRTRRTHSSMDCQHVALGPSVAVGSTEEQRNRGAAQPARRQKPRQPGTTGSVAVVFESQLGRVRLPLVRPTDSPLHLVLNSIECVDLD